MWTDASLAVGGARARSGILAAFDGAILVWKSQRQPLCAWSACEAELEAMSLGLSEGVRVFGILEALYGGGQSISHLIHGDNTGAITNDSSVRLFAHDIPP